MRRRGGGVFFNLARTMVSVHHKSLECKVEKHKCKKLELMQPRINKSELPLVNKPSWISLHEVLQS